MGTLPDQNEFASPAAASSNAEGDPKDFTIPAMIVTADRVLSAIDFATVEALKIHSHDRGNDDLKYDYQKKIDEIRMKPEYGGKYSQSEKSGFVNSGAGYSTHKRTAKLYAVNAEIITDRNRFVHDETLVNVGGGMTAFLDIPLKYIALSSLVALGATTPAGELPTATTAALTGLGLWDNKLGKAATVLGAVYSQYNLSVQVGDIKVVVSILDRDKFGKLQITNTRYLFSNTGELK